jgi:hypothetical protein
MKNNKNTECEALQIPQEYFRRRSGIYHYPCGVLNDSRITVTTAHVYRTFTCTHNNLFNFLDGICSHCTHAPALVRHTTHLSRVWGLGCGAYTIQLSVSFHSRVESSTAREYQELNAHMHAPTGTRPQARAHMLSPEACPCVPYS